jgi:hypothetical protein
MFLLNRRVLLVSALFSFNRNADLPELDETFLATWEKVMMQ